MVNNKKITRTLRGNKEQRILECKYKCGEMVNVGHDTVKVICHKCVNKMMQGEIILYDDIEEDEND